MDLGIKGRKAVVLASSRGLGLGIAKALAAEGADVLMCGRNAERLAANVQSINEAGKGEARYVEADLFDRDFVQKMQETIADYGPVDIMVNNSGGPVPGKAADMTAEQLLSFFNAMVVNQITLSNSLIAGMKARNWGRILTVASSGVIEPISNLALSNTLRPALAGWSKTLSAEVASYGITSNLLLPGSIHTDRIDELNAATSGRSGKSIDEVQAAAEAGIPAGRYGRVEEFAATAAFLCSQPASYITGSMIRCDGGANRSV
jgi:3-oxoacyl-[acyl-carrier protein] reductase